MSETKMIKLRNATKKIHNGYAPNAVVNVEAKHAPRYLLEGWKKASDKDVAINDTAEAVKVDLSKMTLVQLKELAEEKGLEGYESMKSKAEVIALIEAGASSEEEDETDPDLAKALND